MEKKGMKLFEGLYAMNRVSQDFMIRPMGIFQLIDYVGLDVFQLILKVMCNHLNDKTLHSDLIDEFLNQGVKGGQFADGSQKDGFLKYEKNRPVGAYCTSQKKYILYTENNWAKAIEERLGALPAGHSPWKVLLSDKGKEQKLEEYFKTMKAMTSLGAILAMNYLRRSKEIGLYLKSSGVTDDVENVNGVLANGFYHLYGPVNKYC